MAIGVLVFTLAVAAGVASKFLVKPAGLQKYDVTWGEGIGTRECDLSYGEGEANRFDLYLPKDDTRDSYGLVVYLHAGGFTTGDKSDDEKMLSRGMWRQASTTRCARMGTTPASSRSRTR